MGLITILLFLNELFRKKTTINKKENSLNFLAVLIATFSLGAFFVNYKFIPSAPFIMPSLKNINNYYSFIIHMLSSSWSAYILPTVLKQLFLALFLICILIVFFNCFNKSFFNKMIKYHQIYSINTILIGFSILFMIFTAIGRISLGVNTGSAPRYATLLIPMYLGVYFYINTFNENLKKYFLFSYFAIILISTILIVPLFSNNVCIFYRIIQNINTLTVISILILSYLIIKQG